MTWRVEMSICNACLPQNYCSALGVPLTTNEQINNSLFICDVRVHAFNMKIPSRRWQPMFADIYMNMIGRVRAGDFDHDEHSLNMEVLEGEHVRYWFRDTYNRLPASELHCRVRDEARERFRVTSTLLRSLYPVAAMHWGLRLPSEYVTVPFPRRQRGRRRT